MAAPTVVMDEEEELFFVSSPPEFLQLKCPICLELLIDRSPYLVVCCGNHICSSCINSLTNKPCPLCKSVLYQKVPDKGHQRAMNCLQVYCTNKEKGCEWSGDLKCLGQHKTAVCLYEEFECKYECGYKAVRNHTYEHESNLCSLRPTSCEYCQQYESTYKDVTSAHYKVCPGYPVFCSNGCGDTLTRNTLEKHLTKDCSLRKIPCEFAEMGCQWTGTFVHLQKHLTDDWRHHIAFATLHNSKEIREEMNKLKDEMYQLKLHLSERIAALEDNQKEEHGAMKESSHSSKERLLTSSPETDDEQSQVGQVPMQQGQQVPMQQLEGQVPMQQQEQVPIQQGQVPMQQQGQVPIQQGQVPMQQGQVPMQQGQVSMQQQGQVPIQQGLVLMQQQGQVPMQQGQVPMQQGQVPIQQGQVPMQQGQVPIQQGQVPFQQQQPMSKLWTGYLETIEYRQQRPQARQTQCTLLASKPETAADIKPELWPSKLTMSVYPKQVFNAINSIVRINQTPLRTVQFQFMEQPQSITMLKLLMNSDRQNKKVAIVRLAPVTPQCPIKAFFVVWNDKCRQFTGLIPLEQENFVSALKQVLTKSQSSVGDGVVGEVGGGVGQAPFISGNNQIPSQVPPTSTGGLEDGVTPPISSPY